MIALPGFQFIDAALIAALITKLGRAFTPIAVKTVLTIS